MNITLYAAPFSSAIPVVHAFDELRVPHERVMLDLQAGDQRKPSFLELNPNGKVPTVVVDGTPIFEALAIMQWLGDRFGVERGLWPAPASPERLEALSWSTWMYVSFSSAFKRFGMASKTNPNAALHHQEQADFAAAELDEMLGVVDRRLASRAQLMGHQFTLVDLIVGSGISYAKVAGFSPQGHRNVERWLAEFEARPAYARAWSAG